MLPQRREPQQQTQPQAQQQQRPHEQQQQQEQHAAPWAHQRQHRQQQQQQQQQLAAAQEAPRPQQAPLSEAAWTLHASASGVPLQTGPQRSMLSEGVMHAPSPPTQPQRPVNPSLLYSPLSALPPTLMLQHAAACAGSAAAAATPAASQATPLTGTSPVANSLWATAQIATPVQPAPQPRSTPGSPPRSPTAAAAAATATASRAAATGAFVYTPSSSVPSHFGFVPPPPPSLAATAAARQRSASDNAQNRSGWSDDASPMVRGVSPFDDRASTPYDVDSAHEGPASWHDRSPIAAAAAALASSATKHRSQDRLGAPRREFSCVPRELPEHLLDESTHAAAAAAGDDHAPAPATPSDGAGAAGDVSWFEASFGPAAGSTSSSFDAASRAARRGASGSPSARAPDALASVDLSSSSVHELAGIGLPPQSPVTARHIFDMDEEFDDEPRPSPVGPVRRAGSLAAAASTAAAAASTAAAADQTLEAPESDDIFQVDEEAAAFEDDAHIRLIDVSQLRVRRDKLLGSNQYYAIYAAHYGPHRAAIKLLQVQREDTLHEFTREAAILSIVPPHPSVVRFFGACLEENSLFLVEERADFSLDLLLSMRDEIEMTPEQQRLVALGVARGIAHLHSNSIVHRDLKSGNVLIFMANESDISAAKVCDFGMARIKSRVNRMTAYRGTVHWSAPEVFSPSDAQLQTSYDEKVDIYSLGVVLWEIVSSERPWIDVCDRDIIERVVNGERPFIPNQCPDDVAQLICECWCADPTRRPTAAEVVARLEHMTFE